MWRGNDWCSSLPPPDENNFEVESNKQLFNGKEILNKHDADSGTARTLIEVVKKATSVDRSMSESEHFSEDPLNPNLVNDVMLSSPSTVSGLCNSMSVSGTEPSVVAPLELSTSNPVSAPLKSALYGQSIISTESENGERLQRSPDDSGKSEQYLDELAASTRLMSSTDEIDELETRRRNNEDTNGLDCVKSGSYMEGMLILLKQATNSGRAHVLDENEFVDADFIYQKSVAFGKTAPRGPVFQNAQRKSSVSRNEPDKGITVSKHAVNRENEVPTDVERKEDVDRGLGKQRNDNTQEFLSDVVPQGTLRVDELAKLLA